MLVLALKSFAQGVRKYWVTSTAFGLIVSTLTWVGLASYGIPLAIVWAVLAFVTNYIPNIGFVIGLVPAAVMGLLAKGPWGAVFVIALYAALNFVIQGVLQPKVAGEAVGVTSTVSFLSLLVWAVVLGPLGALLALPATLFVKALVVDSDPNARWVNALIASNPRTSSEEPVLVSDEVAPVDPLVPQGVPPEDAGVPTPDQPRRSPGEDEPEDEAEVVVDEVVPRRSAPEADDEEQAADAVLLVDEAAPVTEEIAPQVQEAEPQVQEAEPKIDEVAPADEPVPEAEDSEPLDEEAEPEDIPRRARSDEDARVIDDEPVQSNTGPVFQKSATQSWTGMPTLQGIDPGEVQ